MRVGFVEEYSETPTIDFGRLRIGFPCISPEGGAHLANAAAVCLGDRGHSAGSSMDVTGSYNSRFSLAWATIDDRVRREWGDLQDATEDGACGLAILLIDALTEYHVVLRSRKGSGFDYFLGLKAEDLFQGSARLEVSGILSGDAKLIDQRVKQKIRQTDLAVRSC